jgi:hypothetical protein
VIRLDRGPVLFAPDGVAEGGEFRVAAEFFVAAAALLLLPLHSTGFREAVWFRRFGPLNLPARPVSGPAGSRFAGSS